MKDKSLLDQVVDKIPEIAKEELGKLTIKKTAKGKDYVHNGIKELDEANKKIADKGGSVLDQYAHGMDYVDCFICDD